MDLNQIRVVAGKELRDSLRDRRTTLLLILMPVALALLYFFVVAYGPEAQLEKQYQVAQEIAIIASDQNEHILREWPQLLSRWGLTMKKLADPEQALTKRELAAVLVLPEDFSERLNRGELSEIIVKFDALRIDSQIAREKLKAFLREYERSVIAQRLVDRNFPVDLLKVVAIQEENVAQGGGVVGTRLGFLVAFLLIVWSTASIFNVAADLTAGEKERGTLEALLVTPTERLALLLGKFLAILVVTLCAMASGVIALRLLVQFWGPDFLPSNLLTSFTNVLSLKVVGPAIVVTIFTALLFGMLALALCLRARSSREAHSYSILIFLVVTSVLFFVEFGEVGISLPALAIPVYNAILVLRELFQGEFNPIHLAITLGVLALWAAVGLWVAMRAFRSEKVLFRQ